MNSMDKRDTLLIALTWWLDSLNGDYTLTTSLYAFPPTLKGLVPLRILMRHKRPAQRSASWHPPNRSIRIECWQPCRKLKLTALRHIYYPQTQRGTAGRKEQVRILSGRGAC